MRKLRDVIGAGGAHDTHARRYTTTAELAALGCDEDLIMAVTGHRSKAMVAHYAGAARPKVCALDAKIAGTDRRSPGTVRELCHRLCQKPSPIG